MPPGEVRNILEMAVRHLAGCAEVFDTPGDAINRLAWRIPRLLIFSDPYPYHGHTLVRVVRKCQGCRFHAIQVTNLNSLEEWKRWLHTSADSYLTTPVTLAKAVQHLQSCLQRWADEDHGPPARETTLLGNAAK